MDKDMRRAVLAVAGAAVLWSSGGLFIKLAPMPALAVACGRSLIAAIFYLVVLRPDLRLARWTTAAAYAGCIVTFVSATKLTTAANAIFLQDTAPLYVLALSPMLLDERPTRSELLAVPVFILGLALFFVDRLAPGQVWGNMIALASGVSFALCIMGLRAVQDEGQAVLLWGNLLAGLAGLAQRSPGRRRRTPGTSPSCSFSGPSSWVCRTHCFSTGSEARPRWRRRCSCCWSRCSIRSGRSSSPASARGRGR
jgi:drug/metabolite transporter (DMT)-like permease